MDERLDKLRRLARRFVAKTVDKIKEVAPGGETRTPPPSGEAFPRWTPSDRDPASPAASPATLESETESVVQTSDLCVLMGLRGLLLALEPRDKPLLVNHWATWCEACVEEISLLVQLRLKWKDKVDFVAVGWEGFEGDRSPAEQVGAVEQASSTHGVDWPTLIYEGTPASLFEGLGLTSEHIPQTAVFSASGDRITTHEGVLDDDAIAMIEAALRGCLGET